MESPWALHGPNFSNEEGLAFSEIIKKEYELHLGDIFKKHEEERIAPLTDFCCEEAAGPSGIKDGKINNCEEAAGPSGIEDGKINNKNKLGEDMFITTPVSLYSEKYSRTKLQNNERQHMLKRLFFLFNNGSHCKSVKQLFPLSKGEKIFINLTVEQQSKVADHVASFFESRNLKIKKKKLLF